MSHPVRRLHHDLKALHQARAHLHSATRELHKDQRELSKDKRELGQDRDAFQTDTQALKASRAQLQNEQSNEQTMLTVLDNYRQTLQARYDATHDPVIGEELQAVDQLRTDLKAELDGEIAQTQASISTQAHAVAQARGEVKSDVGEIHRDTFEMKHDHNLVSRDQKHVHNARHRALHDLKPAEYKMNLHDTNRARRDLGLKPVHHVIRPEKGSVAARKFVAQAMKFLGQPYLWGGGHGATFSRPGPVDCSGLVTQAARMAHVRNLDGTAAVQQDMGRPVALSTKSLRAGDLVFMGNPAHHVGIYIGHNKVIEAPHTGDHVKIVSMTGYGWQSARRVF
jgi:hypothetical protein